MGMQKIHVGMILGVAIVGIVMIVLVTSLLTAYQTIPSTVNVNAIGLGVYWNSACTNNVTKIDWDYLKPGTATNRTVYIKNEGNIPFSLSMTEGNWTPPSASGYITLSWNREGYELEPEATVQAVLTLSVSSNITGVTSINFDIIVTGTEQA